MNDFIIVDSLISTNTSSMPFLTRFLLLNEVYVNILRYIHPIPICGAHSQNIFFGENFYKQYIYIYI